MAPPGFTGVWLETPVEAWIPVMMQADVKYVQNYSSRTAGRAEALGAARRHPAGSTSSRAPIAPDGPEAVALNAVFRPLLLKEIDAITDEKERALTLDRRLVLEPFGMGFSNLREQFRAPLYALLGMVALLLLIACANTANLLLARATSRQREMAVRLSIGASRGRIITQLLIESLMLGALAAAVGLAIAPLVSELLVRMTMGVETGPLPFSVGIDARVIVFTASITLLTSFLFGFAPAWRATDLSLSTALEGERAQHAPGRAAQPVEAAGRRRRWRCRCSSRSAPDCSRAASTTSSRSRSALRIRCCRCRSARALAATSQPNCRGSTQRIIERVEAIPGVQSATIAMCGVMTGLPIEQRRRRRSSGYTSQPGEQVMVPGEPGRAASTSRPSA